jgi:hypothetical protein
MLILLKIAVLFVFGFVALGVCVALALVVGDAIMRFCGL